MPALRPRILVTEADPDTCEIITIILSQEGFEVICAEGPDKALELARTGTFDLFLVDNWMPGWSGPELTEKIRQFDRKTPVLFYSGAAYEQDKEDARRSGAQGYLVKPADCDELITEVKRIIAESKLALLPQAA
ncbi:MAG: hypothetical protein QOK48_3167 [Blastocatellia bacterium]|jgi:DNA-binding response OmpR family regulator|nr:hypothetical protein [Blastocatellia bacterium]